MSSEMWERVAVYAFLLCLGGCLMVISAVDTGIMTSIDHLIIGVSFLMLMLTGFASLIAGISRETERIQSE